MSLAISFSVPFAISKLTKNVPCHRLFSKNKKFILKNSFGEPKSAMIYRDK